MPKPKGRAGVIEFNYSESEGGLFADFFAADTGEQLEHLEVKKCTEEEADAMLEDFDRLQGLTLTFNPGGQSNE